MLVLAFDKAISVYTGCFDAGLFAMAITLAAHERGLGTCIVGSAVRYADLMHKHLPDLDDKNVVDGHRPGLSGPGGARQPLPAVAGAAAGTSSPS